MTSFTPLTSAIGGALIGVSATMMLMLNGRVAGIVSIFGGVVHPTKGDFLWRLLFVAGLVIGGAMLVALRPSAVTAIPGTSMLVTIVAGLLVGFGSRLGAGCTSGHGVCGISRWSKRSIAATTIFMATAAATVFVVRHVLGGAS